MKIRSVITVLLLLSALPVTARDMVRMPQQVADPQMTDICRQLITATEKIEELLLKVKDFESAQAAAPAMQKQLNHVRELLQRLEEAPTDIATNRVITRTMTTLTHITQRYIPEISRLQTAGAYGSESLLTVLQVLGSDDPYAEDEPPPAPPATQPDDVCAALCRHLSDVLYELRKTTDSYSARNTAAMLRQWQHEQQQLCEQWKGIAAVSSSQPIEQRDKLTRLQAELAAEIDRLRQTACYDDPDLPALLRQYAELPL